MAFLLSFCPGFVSFMCAYGFETWKGTQETFKKKPPKEIWMTLCIVLFLLGFKNWVLKVVITPFIWCAVEELNFKKIRGCNVWQKSESSFLSFRYFRLLYGLFDSEFCGIRMKSTWFFSCLERKIKCRVTCSVSSSWSL